MGGKGGKPDGIGKGGKPDVGKSKGGTPDGIGKGGKPDGIGKGGKPDGIGKGWKGGKPDAKGGGKVGVHEAYAVGPHRAAHRHRGGPETSEAGLTPWQRLALELQHKRDDKPYDEFKGPLRRPRGGWVRHGKFAPARRAQL